MCSFFPAILKIEQNFDMVTPGLYLRVRNENFSTKTYVVGTQKNRLNETVLLSTQNIC